MKAKQNQVNHEQTEDSFTYTSISNTVHNHTLLTSQPIMIGAAKYPDITRNKKHEHITKVQADIIRTVTTKLALVAIFLNGSIQDAGNCYVMHIQTTESKRPFQVVESQ